MSFKERKYQQGKAMSGRRGNIRGAVYVWWMDGVVRCRLDKDSTTAQIYHRGKDSPWLAMLSTMLCSTKSCPLFVHICGAHYWEPTCVQQALWRTTGPLCCGRAFNGAASIMLLLRLETSIRPLYHHSTTPLSSLMDINHHQHEQHIKTNHCAKFTGTDLHLGPSQRPRTNYVYKAAKFNTTLSSGMAGLYYWNC